MGKRLPVGRAAARAPRRARAAAAAADVVTEPLPIVEPSSHSQHPESNGSLDAVTSAAPVADDPLTVGADDLPDGLVVADAAGRVVALNRAAERVLGRTAVDVVGRD